MWKIQMLWCSIVPESPVPLEPEPKLICEPEINKCSRPHDANPEYEYEAFRVFQANDANAGSSVPPFDPSKLILRDCDCSNKINVNRCRDSGRQQ